jgi:Cu/Ag efflux pump CusA
VAVIGGLISATLLTLFVLPAPYLVFTGNERRRTAPPARR